MKSVGKLHLLAVISAIIILLMAGCLTNQKTGNTLQNTAEQGASYEIPEREKILEPYILEKVGPYYVGKNWIGGIRTFGGLTLSSAKMLVEKGYLDSNGTENNSPTAAEFIAFMEKWEKYDVRANGYEVSKVREDVRVTIYGLALRRPVNDPEFMADWKKFNQDADEMTDTYSWWD